MLCLKNNSPKCRAVSMSFVQESVMAGYFRNWCRAQWWGLADELNKEENAVDTEGNDQGVIQNGAGDAEGINTNTKGNISALVMMPKSYFPTPVKAIMATYHNLLQRPGSIGRQRMVLEDFDELCTGTNARSRMAGTLKTSSFGAKRFFFFKEFEWC